MRGQARPRGVPPLLLLCALAFLPGWLPGNRLAETNRAGNRAYAEEGYEEALRRYTEAQALAPGDARLSYNLGNVLARQEKAEEALKAWAGALQSAPSRELQARSAYNSGNVLYGQEKYRDAVAAYKEALLRTPSDRDAKRNLELALRKMQEQQKEQQEKQQGQPKDQQDQKPEDRQDSGKEDSQQGGAGSPPPEPGGDQSPAPEPSQGEQGGASGEDRNQDMERLLEMIQQEEQKALREEQVREREARRPSDRDW